MRKYAGGLVLSIVALACPVALAGDREPGWAGWVTHSPEREAVASDIVLGKVGEFRLIKTEPNAFHPYFYATHLEVTGVEKGDLQVGDRIQVQFHTIYDEDRIERAHRFAGSCAPRLYTPYPGELARVYLTKSSPSTFVTDYPEGMLAIGDYLDQAAVDTRRQFAEAKFWRLRVKSVLRLGLISMAVIINIIAFVALLYHIRNSVSRTNRLMTSSQPIS